jgi:uncharacterized protein YjiS (DUF1127 family)
MLHCTKGVERVAAMTLRRTRLLDRNGIMTAQFTKDQFNYSLGDTSYVDYSYDAPPARVAVVPSLGIGKWLSRFMAAIADWRRRQAVMREMETLTDRELADIGLSRADLPRVFDPGFAADHARGRDYIAY